MCHRDRTVLVLVLIALSGAVFTGSADAATLSRDGPTITFRGDFGQNNLTVTRELTSDGDFYSFADSDAPTVNVSGPACEPKTAGHAPRCIATDLEVIDIATRGGV